MPSKDGPMNLRQKGMGGGRGSGASSGGGSRSNGRGGSGPQKSGVTKSAVAKAPASSSKPRKPAVSNIADVDMVIKKSWDLPRHSVDKMIKEERTYLENLRRSDAMKKPITMKWKGGKWVVSDGHHRLAAHYLAGRKIINVKYMD